MPFNLHITQRNRGRQPGSPGSCAIAEAARAQRGGDWWVPGDGYAYESQGPFYRTRHKIDADGKRVVKTHDLQGPKAVPDQVITLGGKSRKPSQSQRTTESIRNWTTQKPARSRMQATARPGTASPSAQSQPRPGIRQRTAEARQQATTAARQKTTAARQKVSTAVRRPFTTVVDRQDAQAARRAAKDQTHRTRDAAEVAAQRQRALRGLRNPPATAHAAPAVARTRWPAPPQSMSRPAQAPVSRRPATVSQRATAPAVPSRARPAASSAAATAAQRDVTARQPEMAAARSQPARDRTTDPVRRYEAPARRRR